MKQSRLEKKTLGWLASALSLSLLAPMSTEAVEFLDTADHWGKSYIEKLADEGFVKGKEEDSEGRLSFKPQDTMTQAEFLVVVLAAFPYEGELSQVTHPEYWWAEFYNQGEAKGVIPSHWTLETAGSLDITREEMAAVCHLVLSLEGETLLEPYDSSKIGDFSDIQEKFRTAVQLSFAMGIVSGQEVNEDGLAIYAPQGKMTRAEACVVLGNLIWEENRTLPERDDVEEDLNQDAEDSGENPEEDADVTPEDSTDVTPEDNTDVTPEDSTDVTPEDNTDVTPEDNTDVTPEDNTDVTPEDNTDVTPEDNTDVTPEDNTDVTPEDNTDVTPEEDSEEEPLEEEAYSLELEDQFAVIAAALSTWSENKGFPEPSAYMVTDLDQNGRLELISTVTTGTGSSSINEYYQISETGGSLDLIPVVRTHSDLTPDWYLEETMDVFYDGNTHTYYYDVFDLWREGSTCTYYSNFGWWIENNRVYTAMYRQEQDRINDEGFNRTTSYWNGKNETITKEQFDDLGSAYFEGMDELKGTFSWFQFDPSFVSNPEKLVEKLQESYEGFTLSPVETAEEVAQ